MTRSERIYFLMCGWCSQNCQFVYDKPLYITPLLLISPHFSVTPRTFFISFYKIFLLLFSFNFGYVEVNITESLILTCWEISCIHSIKVSPDETKFDMSKNIKSIWTVPYTVLEGKIGLHSQVSVVKFQKYPKTFFLYFFVSPEIVRNVVALTHFFARCATRWKDVRIRKYLCIYVLFWS